ncbi:hypothetical protein HMPREF1982_02970 [Clostridiales bacterium oral taxon 876 str. F0540]|nr:hypothetical protein HMPREF1982_02970 [Clostridiales bacterium oral taxon 876 str. F0540]
MYLYIETIFYIGDDNVISKKRHSSKVETLDMNDDEENGFFEGDVDFGKALVSFNFSAASLDNKISLKEDTIKSITTCETKTDIFSSSPRGLTPAVDGETYSIKRGYQFRPSTIRKLNEIKAKHPDLNIYLNTIIDDAINYYYNYIFSKKNN